MIDDIWVSPELFEKFPDYSVSLLTVQGVRGGASNELHAAVLHRIPIGGENLNAYFGVAHLTIATGDETFDARNNGEIVLQHPELGEVIWRDDIGATCRQWNWRQCVRTRLDDNSTSLLFIVDGLGDDSADISRNAADHLRAELLTCWPDATISTRTLTAE